MELGLAFLLSFVPAFFYAWILYWMDRYEKEPLSLLVAVFLWGAIVAAVAAFVANTLISVIIFLVTESQQTAEVAGASLSAPLVEETLKGFAVLLVYLIVRHEFDSILDGIVYGGIVALGFAATENFYYLYMVGYKNTLAQGGSPEDAMSALLILFLLRVLVGAWGHPFYTAFTGIGLALSRLNRNLIIKFLAPLGGWCLAVFFHFLHNTMTWMLGERFGLGGLAATIAVDWLGWVLMLGIILWAIGQEGRWISTYLREEVDQGIITSDQYQTACSAWKQSAVRFRATFAGRRRTTGLFYRLCSELAQKKYQRQVLGEENGNSAIIEELRSEIARLAPLALV